jgi:hypothetical protein
MAYWKNRFKDHHHLDGAAAVQVHLLSAHLQLADTHQSFAWNGAKVSLGASAALVVAGVDRGGQALCSAFNGIRRWSSWDPRCFLLPFVGWGLSQAAIGSASKHAVCPAHFGRTLWLIRL